MPVSDYNRVKLAEINDNNDSGSTVSKAQPIIVSGGDDTSTGTGDCVIDFSNISDAQDIAVYDEDGNLLDYEVEELDTTAETGVLWVYNDWTRDASRQVVVAYGDNSANTDRQNVTGTWDNTGQNAEAVYHWDETSGATIDSTSNNHDSTSTTGTTYDVDGQFNGGRGFDGVDDNVDIPSNDSSFDFEANTQQFTKVIGFQSRYDHTQQLDIFQAFHQHERSHFVIEGDSDATIQLSSNIGGNVLTTGFAPVQNEEYTMAVRYDNGSHNIVVDSDQKASQTTTLEDQTGIDLHFGSFGSGGYADVILSEARIYSDNKSDTWIQADYDASPKAGQTFFTWDAAQDSLVNDYDKRKFVDVDSVSGTPTVSKAQPIILGSGDDSSTGNGDIQLDWKGINSEQDVAVFDENGDLLNYEVESLDTTNETGVIWVYNDWVRDGSTQAQVAYGNNDANVDRQDVTGTWDNTGQNAVGVWHLNGDANDSTANNNDGTINGATKVDGPFGGGYSFDGTDDRIVISSDTSLDRVGDFTNVGHASIDESNDTAGQNYGFINRGVDFDDTKGLSLFSNDDEVRVDYRTASGAEDSFWGYFYNDSELVDKDIFYGGQVRESDMNGRIFLDGDSVTLSRSNTESTSIGAASGDMYIGNLFSGTNNTFKGDIYEVRIYSDYKSSDWFKAEYDASPKAGQVFFSQQAAETNKITDYNKKKELSVSSTNDTGTTQDKAQPIILTGSGTAYELDKFSLKNSQTLSENSLISGITFKPDGSKLYISGFGDGQTASGREILEYNLSTNYDVTTASFNQAFEIGSGSAVPDGVRFNDDGTKMFVVDDNDNTVKEYSLSTAYDISSASISNTLDVSTNNDSVRGIDFGDNGSKMYIVGNTNVNINEYELSTAYDTTTASFNQAFDVSNQAADPRAVEFDGDGNIMMVIDDNDGTIYEYGLSTAWDVSTASNTDSASSSGTTGLKFDDDGTNIYTVDGIGGTVYNYNLKTTESTTGTGDVVIDFTNISDEQDIAVFDQDGNLLDYEIESLDTTNNTAVVWAYNSWVRDDTVQAQIAYGNNDANVDRQNVTGTWNNTGQNAEMVQHLQDDPLTATDSTSNNNDGVPSGGSSTVSRNNDDKVFTESDALGIRINPNSDLNKIDCTLSQNYASATTFFLADNNGNLLASKDISGLAAGDTFTIEYSFSSGTGYNLLVGTGDSNTHEAGTQSTLNTPNTSTYVDITEGVRGGGSDGYQDGDSIGTAGSYFNIVSVTGYTRIASTTGQFDGAASFDATDDDITISDDATLDFGSNDFTIITWFNTNDVTNQQQFLAKDTFGSGYGLRIKNSGDALEFVVDDGSTGIQATGSGLSSSDNNTWHLAAGVRDTSTTTGRLYFNDGERATADFSNLGNLDNSYPVLIGAWGKDSNSGGTNDIFDGELDATRLYKDNKKSNWIQAEYDASPKANQIYFDQSSAQSTDTATTLNLTETVNASEVYDRVSDYFRTQNEAASVNESYERVVDYFRTRQEKVNTSDSFDRSVDYFRTNSEDTSISEEVVKKFFKDAVENVAVNEDYSREIGYFRDNSEDVVVDDTVNVIRIIAETLSENVAVSETLSRFLATLYSEDFSVADVLNDNAGFITGTIELNGSPASQARVYVVKAGTGQFKELAEADTSGNYKVGRFVDDETDTRYLVAVDFKAVDGFEDGDFTNNPTWSDFGSNSPTVVQSDAREGDFALDMSGSDGATEIINDAGSQIDMSGKTVDYWMKYSTGSFPGGFGIKLTGTADTSSTTEFEKYIGVLPDNQDDDVEVYDENGNLHDTANFSNSFDDGVYRRFELNFAETGNSLEVRVYDDNNLFIESVSVDLPVSSFRYTRYFAGDSVDTYTAFLDEAGYIRDADTNYYGGEKSIEVDF